ncbi:MAG TPA: hypothetical protein VK574_19590 [Terracidiphilus sp.]|nr:hypothetical protein [Terracidiphilus sp.]
MTAMNPLPAPFITGKTDAERFSNAVRKVLTTIKQDAMKTAARPQPKAIPVEVVPLVAIPKPVLKRALLHPKRAKKVQPAR